MYMDHCVIYDHPADYPAYFVSRWYRIEDGQLQIGRARLFDTLEEARAEAQQRGLVRLERNPEDDPVILETWV